MYDINEILYLPDSSPYGLSFGKWTERWWRWCLSIPKPHNPAGDTTGEHCAKNQEYSDVWFLAGTLGGAAKRKCTISKETAILFPIIVDEQSLAEKPSLSSDTELEALAKSENGKVLEMSVLIDGIQVPDLREYRIQTKAFDIVLPENNIWGVKAGPTRAAADGYWMFLKPLGEGDHTIDFSGKGPIFFTKVTYNLSIVDETRN
jgi:hypothetical protein